jgi:hypothetical protein
MSETLESRTTKPDLHRSIHFLEHVFPHFDHVVRPDADDPAIKGGVVNLA